MPRPGGEAPRTSPLALAPHAHPAPRASRPGPSVGQRQRSPVSALAFRYLPGHPVRRLRAVAQCSANRRQQGRGDLSRGVLRPGARRARARHRRARGSGSESGRRSCWGRMAGCGHQVVRSRSPTRGPITVMRHLDRGDRVHPICPSSWGLGRHLTCRPFQMRTLHGKRKKIRPSPNALTKTLGNTPWAPRAGSTITAHEHLTFLHAPRASFRYPSRRETATAARTAAAQPPAPAVPAELTAPPDSRRVLRQADNVRLCRHPDGVVFLARHRESTCRAARPDKDGQGRSVDVVVADLTRRTVVGFRLGAISRLPASRSQYSAFGPPITSYLRLLIAAPVAMWWPRRARQHCHRPDHGSAGARMMCCTRAHARASRPALNVRGTSTVLVAHRRHPGVAAARASRRAIPGRRCAGNEIWRASGLRRPPLKTATASGAAY